MVGPILVTGGTGTLGRLAVKRLRAAGYEVVVLSRRVRGAAEPADDSWRIGDLRTGVGIDAAVAQAQVVVHCASSPHGDLEAARKLVEAAQRMGSPHIVYISIVGVDRVPLGYYRSKLEVERLIKNCGLPYTILRSTQFHDLILRGCASLARPPVMLVPAGVSFQPIDAAEVADRLAELATAPPAGRSPDVGGPQVLSTGSLAHAYLQASHRHRPLLPVRLPGAAFAAYRRGEHLAPRRAVGRVTFGEFLSERVSSLGSSAPGPKPGSFR
jgi:uncharacterized protein YbjT (DUF2867 family)